MLFDRLSIFKNMQFSFIEQNLYSFQAFLFISFFSKNTSYLFPFSEITDISQSFTWKI